MKFRPNCKVFRKMPQKHIRALTKMEMSDQLHRMKSRFLSNDRVEEFVDFLFQTAMDDDHKCQHVAIKEVSSRLLPQVSFSSIPNHGGSAIQINISGLEAKIEEKTVSDAEDIVAPNGHGEILDIEED